MLIAKLKGIEISISIDDRKFDYSLQDEYYGTVSEDDLKNFVGALQVLIRELDTIKAKDDSDIEEL